MKLKNINLSFFILASLIVLSFAFFVGAENNSYGVGNIFLDSDQDGLSDEEEKMYGTNPAKADTDGDSYSDGAEVRSGYDPTKPAPGDRLNATAGDANTEKTGAVLGDSEEKNLTSEVAQKISELVASSEGTDKQISMEEVQTLVDESINNNTVSENALPEIAKEDLNIKKQNYGKLSEAKAKEKRKEDFLNYITAVLYIFSSNSPQPITSLSDAPNMLSDITKTITNALTSRNTAGLQTLMDSQKKITEQLKTVEVPEELVDIHIKALRFALYSENLGKLIQPKADDPLGEIANLSKMEGFISSFSSFASEMESKFAEYGVTYDETVQKKLKSYGIDAPADLSGLQSLIPTSNP
ncbi:MAG TPA: hypothetical protein DCS28_03810 [Candidatus Moranbacteria bacterium]|nr:hypothetical protein [Candidatus Moranbacteria bacterium]HAT75137.1 hypothetical protein [Candidatus Moranbacteria bacterium]